MAESSTSTQLFASIVLVVLHPMIRRLKRSMTAITNARFPFTAVYVISVAQT